MKPNLTLATYVFAVGAFALTLEACGKSVNALSVDGSRGNDAAAGPDSLGGAPAAGGALGGTGGVSGGTTGAGGLVGTESAGNGGAGTVGAGGLGAGSTGGMGTGGMGTGGMGTAGTGTDTIDASTDGLASSGAGGTRSGITCGGRVCPDTDRCCGPPECGRCIPALSGAYCPDLCSASACGPSGAPCQVGEICLDVVVSSAATATGTAKCIANPCGSQPLACACVGTTCQDADALTTCAQADASSGALRCIGGGKCASPETPIATPEGNRPIADLRPGDLVYSEHEGALVAVPLVQVARRPVAGHVVVHVVTAAGRRLDISAPHPTADGRRFADLKVGDALDGDRIVVREEVPYLHPFTFDILPASSTGTYVADGLLIGSTLK